jgi:hypothetical protein
VHRNRDDEAVVREDIRCPSRLTVVGDLDPVEVSEELGKLPNGLTTRKKIA